jgi:AcrR family transcriptional regulator
MASRRGIAPLRTELIEAAARLIADGGATALTLRRLAAEAGTSTMAIYTHFGGTAELRRAIREEGYLRLAARLASVPASDDPVDRLVRLFAAYLAYAIEQPELYRVMFMEQQLGEEDAAACAGTFDTLQDAVSSCIDGRRFAPADAEALATELWATGHGVVALQLAGLLSPVRAAACADGALTRLLIGWGAEPHAVESAVARAGAAS